MASSTWAEDEIGRKWDLCITDALFKLGKCHLIFILVITFSEGVKYISCC